MNEFHVFEMTVEFKSKIATVHAFWEMDEKEYWKLSSS